MKHPLKFSVVIANYNYAAFLARAIDSALGLDWPLVEVIVVDDGSIDNSGEIIGRYDGKIAAILQSNAGQRVANNVGFDLCTGDVVIFLDADDVLEPELAREIAAIWHDGISKVQVQMRRVDVNETPLGSIVPRLTGAPSAQQIRRWARTSLEYPSPPGSGNAYSKAFLRTIFPLDAARDSFTDSTCIAMAPFLGDVETVALPLVRYRIHGSNDSNLLANDGHFGREVARAMLRLKAAQDACEMHGLDPPPPNALRAGSHLLQLRAASRRLCPAKHPLPDDRRRRILADALMLPFRASFEPLGRRLLFAAFSILTLLLPIRSARALIRMRFAQ